MEKEIPDKTGMERRVRGIVMRGRSTRGKKEARWSITNEKKTINSKIEGRNGGERGVVAVKGKHST